MEVRTSLEKLAIELACDRITEDDIHDLKLACKDFEESFGKDDLTTIAEKDVAFHDIIFRSTKNARLIQILNNLREQMYVKQPSRSSSICCGSVYNLFVWWVYKWGFVAESQSDYLNFLLRHHSAQFSVL